MTVKETAEWLRTRDNFILITHARPDGDTLGSAAGLAAALRRMGKTAYLFPNPEATARYLEYVGGLFAPEGWKWDAAIAVDVADESLLPLGGEDFAGKVELCIDHHPSNSLYAKNTLLRPHCAACGEIIYRLILMLDVKLDKEMANYLYLALATDTGCFVYSSTTAGTLRIAAALVAAGAENGPINKKLFRTKSRSRIALEAQLYAGIRFYRAGKIAVMTVTRKMIDETGSDENSMDDLAALPGQIEGVVVAATVKELKNGDSKISVRSRPIINAGKICAHFGGGGHTMAAGCTIRENTEKARELLLDAIDQEWQDA